MASKNTRKTSKASQKAQNIIRLLSERFKEREVPTQRIISGMLAALIARKHISIIGPPGTAKSLMIRYFVDACGLGGAHFEWGCDQSTTPDALFGPIDLKRYVNDGVFAHLTKYKLPEAKTAFIDEGWKLPNVTQNKALPILNENVFHNGNGPQPCQLEWVAIASNEYPEATQDAMFDRFPFKFWIDYLADRDNFIDLIINGTPKPVPSNMWMTAADLDELRAEAAAIPFGKPEASKLADIRDAVRKSGFVVSDRTWVRCVEILRARAALDGHSKIETSDWHVLCDVLWKTHDQRPALMTAIGTAADPFGMQARVIVDGAVTSLRAIPPFSELESGRTTKPAFEATLAKCRSEIVAAVEKINNLKDEVGDDSIDEYVTQVEDAYADLRDLLEKVVRFRPVRRV